MENIFISYSHKDSKWLERVKTQLNIFSKEDVLQTWDDNNISAGVGWKNEIKKALNECSASILLISADFLNSAFILSEEIPTLLYRKRNEGVRIFPLIVEPCLWNKISWISDMQVRPKNAKPLSSMSNYKWKEAITSLVDEIHSHLHSPEFKKKSIDPKISLSLIRSLIDRDAPPSEICDIVFNNFNQLMLSEFDPSFQEDKHVIIRDFKFLDTDIDIAFFSKNYSPNGLRTAKFYSFLRTRGRLTAIECNDLIRKYSEMIDLNKNKPEMLSKAFQNQYDNNTDLISFDLYAEIYFGKDIKFTERDKTMLQNMNSHSGIKVITYDKLII